MKYKTVPEFARMVGCGDTFLRTYIAKGQLPVVDGTGRNGARILIAYETNEQLSQMITKVQESKRAAFRKNRPRPTPLVQAPLIPPGSNGHFASTLTSIADWLAVPEVDRIRLLALWHHSPGSLSGSLRALAEISEIPETHRPILIEMGLLGTRQELEALLDLLKTHGTNAAGSKGT